MKVLAFVGSHVLAQARIVRAMADRITPDYRVKRLRLDNPGFVGGRRLAAIRRELANGVAGDTVLTVMGVNNVEEFQLLRRHNAMFCILPGALPRLLTSHDIEIGDRFVFVTENPDELETPAKRRLYCDPEAAFSRCLVDELRRKRIPAEAPLNAAR